MEGLDGSIMNTSLPQIALSLHLTPLHLKVALTTYLLAAGVMIPISGWLADKFGIKVIFRLAIVIFLLGSILSGLSNNIVIMVLGRIIQGIGGALSLPLGRLLLVRHFSKAEFIVALSTISSFGLIGPSIGPLIGGFLTTFLNWRFIFFVNIPIGFFALYYVQKHIENTKNPKVKSFDFLGFTILATSLILLLLAFETLTEHTLTGIEIITLGLLGCIGLTAYWFYAKNHERAVISPKLLNTPNFKSIVINSMTIRLALGIIPFLGPLLLQLGLNMSAMMSGLYSGASGIAMIFAKSWVQKLLRRFNAGLIAGTTSILLCLSLNLNILICYFPSPMVILGVFIITGILMSIQYTTVNALAYSTLPHEFQNMGTSFLSSMQQIMQSFGIAVGAFILYLAIDGKIEATHYPLHAFVITYALLSLIPLLSAVGFFKIRHLKIDRGS
jgi:MFS family permease